MTYLCFKISTNTNSIMKLSQRLFARNWNTTSDTCLRNWSVWHFFDLEVPVTVKRRMVQALRSSESNGQCAGPKWITLTANNASTASLEHFVNCNTQKLFRKLQITDDFLNYDPELWATREDYQQGINIVNALLVTNDNAERGVALVQELNKLITHDEEQFQFLLQVVADHRRQFSSCRKSLLGGQSSASDMN